VNSKAHYEKVLRVGKENDELKVQLTHLSANREEENKEVR